jgi:hypothetical protein
LPSEGFDAAGTVAGPVAETAPAAPQASAEDPELELLVFGNRHKIKRSELIQRYDLEGLDNVGIINAAQKHMAADQRLAEAKQAADQRLTETEAQRSAGEGADGRETDQLSAEACRRRRPLTQGNDLLIYQIDRALNTGNASQTIAERIRRDNLALYASLESSDPIESILNRHLVTMSNGANGLPDTR